MEQPTEMKIYLHQPELKRARAGNHNFLGLLKAVLEDGGYAVEFLRSGPEARAEAPNRPGWAMFNMEHPTHDRALVMRQVYHAPFWAIEPVAERWLWRVAGTPFPAEEIDPVEAEDFYLRWRRRLFGAAPETAEKLGYIYAPLQGKLLEQRSFQSASPIGMLRKILASDTKRRVVATLHPKEEYSAEELRALRDLTDANTRLTFSLEDMQTCLKGCDYVVTENSSAAFAGYFFGKTAILFAGIDFHHIALGPDDFDKVDQHRPDFARYLWWFWQEMSINAGRPDAPEQISAALRRAGLPFSSGSSGTNQAAKVVG